jgi:signal transduction histidine kinase
MQDVGEDLKDSALTIRTRVVPVDPDARTLQLTNGRVRLEDLPREGEDYVQIEITDSGCGMDASTMDKIFYPFFTTKESGSGIGLAVAQKIVAEHFGFIDVESQPNAGATFTLKFPVGQRD